MSEHALFLSFTNFYNFSLLDDIELALSGVAEIDGTHFQDGIYTVYIYGSDANEMYRSIFDILKDTQVQITKRYGAEDGAEEEYIVFPLQSAQD